MAVSPDDAQRVSERARTHLTGMETIEGWTAAAACVLQTALRMSNEAFAAHLGIGVRTVGGWHQKPALRPRPDMQQLLDTALSRAAAEARERFAALLGEPIRTAAHAPARQAAGPSDLCVVAGTERIANAVRVQWTGDDQSTTTLLLVEGTFRVDLTTGGVILARPGDYPVWGPGNERCLEALAPCVVITVRWSSAPA